MVYRIEHGSAKHWISFGGMIRLLHERVAAAGDDMIPTETIVACLGITQTEFDAYLLADVAPEEVIKKLQAEYRTYLKSHVIERISITDVHYPDEPDLDDDDDLEEI